MDRYFITLEKLFQEELRIILESQRLHGSYNVADFEVYIMNSLRTTCMLTMLKYRFCYNRNMNILTFYKNVSHNTAKL